MTDKKLIPMFHVGLFGCEKPAFFTTKILISGVDDLSPENCVLLDGSRPEIDAPIICGSCGKKAHVFSLQYKSAYTSFVKSTDAEQGGYLVPEKFVYPRPGFVARICRVLGLRYGWKTIYPQKALLAELDRMRFVRQK